mgnify:CR=1 FL=1
MSHGLIWLPLLVMTAISGTLLRGVEIPFLFDIETHARFLIAVPLMIVAELVAATEGLGKRISLAQRFLRTDEIFVGLIVIGLIGLAIDLGFRFLMRRSCAWAN